MTAASTTHKRRLALFLDGTWNKVSDNTNIWRLRSLFAPAGSDGFEQRAFYSTGLGTKFGEKLRGGMFGSGIDIAITSAYEWLIENYEPDDEIFIFGFSRGAYTARSLSGLVSKCGLLQRGAPLGVNQLFRRYRRSGAKTIRELIAGEHGGDEFRFEENWMLKYARPVDIRFIGVFDTVGALGVPFPILRSIKGPAYPFLNTGLRRTNQYAFHALAMDEHRKAFMPTLWTNMGATTAAPRPVERTEQRWFVGAHANVGGGCFSDPLAQLPLKWLEGKAAALGLGFRDEFATGQDTAMGPISDSYAEFAKGFYRLLTFGQRYHRPVGVPPASEGPGVSNINETIDASVFARWQTDKTYRPPALAAWAKMKNLDLDRIKGSVRADDPTIAVGN
ncbi:MAG: hypothetical protein QOH32_947 [Bradyrhizobium sp.]|jgi:uncharacterized protein (DUF2235 family)|nr:hypothetical protein [Bradyrhizobium sp.]